MLHLLGNDIDDAHDFLSCCDEHELGIIEQHSNDPSALRQIIINIKNDVEDTAKALCMED